MRESKLTARIGGRVVAITGAARGIGRATAEALHRRGAKVVIGDIDGDAVVRAAAEIGPDVEAMRLDVADEQSFAAFLARAEKRFGPLDILINNAGIMPIGPFLDESTPLSKRILDINVAGPLIGMRTALPAMIARGQGHIVNVSSMAGTAPVPGGLTYGASKAAAISMTETARVEFAKAGVFFTCVLPSFTNTELISGTSGTRFFRTLEPGEVAEGIVRAIAARKRDVYLPGALGVMLLIQPLLGRRLRDTLNRLIGADTTFLEFDRAERQQYDSRVGVALSDSASEGAGPEAEEPKGAPTR
ncbi:SDR family NAD(P)-dependent oxidoreductase [Nocardia sp. R6R-6]|uniref:SDR family NAD(P)-dependent oxidoreductase n=1 Tax=Nocardia sp. R6R-6 TaxID=3459303 RepID=UPI00403D683E